MFRLLSDVIELDVCPAETKWLILVCAKHQRPFLNSNKTSTNLTKFAGIRSWSLKEAMAAFHSCTKVKVVLEW